ISVLMSDAPAPFGTGARVIAALARTVEIALDGAELTLAQYRIVSYLIDRPAIPTHLATWLGVRKQSMTRQLDGLVQRGLIERRTAEDDRRRVIYTVTPSGRTALRRTERRLELILDALLAHLDDEEAAGDVRHGLDIAGVALARAFGRAERGEVSAPEGWTLDR